MSYDSDYPQFIKIDSEVKKKYLTPLIQEPQSLFQGREQGEIYLIGAAVGMKEDMREASKKRTDVRLYDTLSEKNKLVIRTIALSDSGYDFEAIKDGGKALRTVEEYANGGLPILHDKVFGESGLDVIEEEVLKLAREE